MNYYFYLRLLPTIANIFLSFVIKFLVDSSHIYGISELFFLELALLDVSVAIHLRLKFIVQQILHLAFAIDDVLRYFLVLLWPEMCLSGLLYVLFIDAFAHLIHLDLFVQNLPNCMLLLLSFDITSHLESTVFLL